MNKTHVIGIGYRPLDRRSRELILSADVILASRRLMEVFVSYEEYDSVKDRVIVIGEIDNLMSYIRENRERQSIVLLASGDPMFFGIGRRMIEEFGSEDVEVLPDLSSVQMAFSRIRESWDDAFFLSLHGGPYPESRRRLPYEIKDIPLLLEAHHKIAILTDKKNNPSAIAAVLNLSFSVPTPAGASPTHIPLMYVCEKLGYPDEKITSGSPERIAGMSFDDPNVVVILKGKNVGRSLPSAPSVAFGLTENEIAHTRGLITKDEIRAVSIHKLKLPREGVLWDIGAGSGSAAIEASRICPELKVYAIEKDVSQVANIEENIARFGATAISVVSGEAPSILEGLPSPDRVFIGGSGGQLSGIIRYVAERVRKVIIVINAVTLDTLNEAIPLLDGNGFVTEISQVSVSRSKMLNGQMIMSPLNPVFVVRGEMK